jgi:hypothetical protein
MLNMPKNGMLKNEAGKALANMLKSNSVLTELNLTDCAGSTLQGALSVRGARARWQCCQLGEGASDRIQRHMQDGRRLLPGPYCRFCDQTAAASDTLRGR